MKYDLFYGSKGGGKIHGCRWEPQGAPRAVVQIVHGIAEHVERFEPLVRDLNAEGFAVVGEDHMGHGRSIGEECPQGYFAGGWFAAVEDTRTLMRYTMNKYPGVPYFLLGISMGSFMVRTLLAKYPDCGISGAILCGTAWQPKALLNSGRMLCRTTCRVTGEKQPSPLLQKVFFGSYNKGIEDAASPNAWLCRDEAVVENYDQDPLCGFPATAGLYRDMLEGIRFIQDPKNIAAMEKGIPILFVAGGRDPVGNYGEGVTTCADAFRAAGMEQVTVKIYPDDRHDVLNELDKQIVRAELMDWIDLSNGTIMYELMD